VRGVAAAGEQAGVVQHGGRGADRGEEFAGGVVARDEFADGGRGAEVLHAGSAGEEEAVEGRGVGGQLGEKRVGFEDELVATDDAARGTEGGDGHGAAGAAEHVDGGDGFEFFKTLWQDGEDSGHGMNGMTMNQKERQGLATKSAKGAEITEANRAGRGRRLVVFGAGYVGGALVRRALAEGWRVVALTRNVETATELRAAGAEVVVGELASEAWWRAPELAGGAERVAVTVAAGGGGAEGYRRSYVEGLRSVVKWGERVRAGGGVAGHLIYTSSTSVYPQDGGVRVTEADPVGGEAETVRALIEAEKIASEWLGVTGASAAVLRLAGIYGPGRTHLVEQVRSGEVSGRADGHLNLIYRDDIIGAMEAVWARAAAGGSDIFNIADEGEATKGEVVAWLAERLGVPMPRFTGLPAGGRRAVTPDRIIDATKAREQLGWRPRWRTFREGYAEVLRD